MEATNDKVGTGSIMYYTGNAMFTHPTVPLPTPLVHVWPGDRSFCTQETTFHIDLVTHHPD